ncbi:MAG TPA: hypothetical protein VKY24_25555 [Reyranella sp.]|nr:hypothetical protein [Reyranella sp.]
MTDRFIGFILLGLGLALGGGPGWAQTPPAPIAVGKPACPSPGTIYTFTDSSSIQALAGATAPFCRFANLNGGQQVDLMLGAFSAASPIVQTNIDVLTSLLPLQVGKTVTLARPGASAAMVTVEKHETVEVPVGTLACYVLLWTEPSGQGRWERRWWYCPSLGSAAKYNASFEVVTPSGRTLSTNPASWELQSVQVP